MAGLPESHIEDIVEEELGRMREREGEIMERYNDGESVEAIAQEVGVPPEKVEIVIEEGISEK